MGKWIKKVATTRLDIRAKVIDTLTGNQTQHAPSVHAVNEGLSTKADATAYTEIKQTYVFPKSNAQIHDDNDRMVAVADGVAFVQYEFAAVEGGYSQFNMRVNGLQMFPSFISSGANAEICGCFSFPIHKDDSVRVEFYNTDVMEKIQIRIIG